MRLLKAAACFALALPGWAFSAPLDFDGDGVSEIVGFENQNDGSLNELVHYLRNVSSAETTRKEYGSSSDIAVPADYDGDGITDIALAHLADSGIVWKQLLSSVEQELTEVSFGQSGDYAIGGCDFDGDGKADLAVYRGTAVSFRKSSDSSDASIELGTADLEYFYCADISGDALSDLIAAKAIVSTTAQKAKKKQVKTTTKYALYAWDAAGNKLLEKQVGKRFSGLLALDSNQDGILEPGFHRKISSALSRISIFQDGASTDFNLPVFSALAGGIFGSEAAPQSFTVDTKVAGQFIRYPSLGNLSAEPVSIPGADTLLPDSNSGLLGSLSSENCTASYKAPDGNEGFLWKPISESTGNAVVLFPAPFRFKSARIEKRGQLLETLYSRGVGNGNRQHWGSRNRASTFPTPLTVVGIKGKERHCWTVTAPNKRID